MLPLMALHDYIQDYWNGHYNLLFHLHVDTYLICRCKPALYNIHICTLDRVGNLPSPPTPNGFRIPAGSEFSNALSYFGRVNWCLISNCCHIVTIFFNRIFFFKKEKKKKKTTWYIWILDPSKNENAKR